MPQDMQWSKTIDEFIRKIEKWYKENHRIDPKAKRGFQEAYDEAIKNVVPYPPDTPKPVRYTWSKQPFTTLCTFFREWYAWTPGIHDGLEYIEKFSWINYENDAGMAFVQEDAGAAMLADFTQLQGRQMDDPASKKIIDDWLEQLGKKGMADYKIEPWENFNQFFIRQVSDGRRPIAAKDDDSVVVAPTDCVINMIVDELSEDSQLPVKTVTMNVRTLLAGSKYADFFMYERDENDDLVKDEHGNKVPAGGTAVSCILMPDTYHWYHAPVAGEVVEARSDIGGVYYGMRDFPGLLNKGNVGYGYDYDMFKDFRRGYLIFKTQYLTPEGEPDGHGYVGLVPVGLNSIASVNFLPKFQATKQKPITTPVPVAKGEQIGNFQYGGSLNILLFEHQRFPALQLLQGQRIGVLQDPVRTEKLFTGAYHNTSRRLRPLIRDASAGQERS